MKNNQPDYKDPTEMPWGKYKGIKFDEIRTLDPRYLRWLIGESFIEYYPNLKSKIEEVLLNAPPL